MARQDEYRRSGVDYEVLDEVKRAAIALAAATAPLMGAVGGTEASESPLFRSSSDRPPQQGWHGDATEASVQEELRLLFGC